MFSPGGHGSEKKKLYSESGKLTLRLTDGALRSVRWSHCDSGAITELCDPPPTTTTTDALIGQQYTLH